MCLGEETDGRATAVHTGQRVVKAEEKFEHRKGGWCWEARGNLDLCGIREGFLEEVLFELGLGVRGIWMPDGEQDPFPERSTEGRGGEGGGSLVPQRGRGRESPAPSIYHPSVPVMPLVGFLFRVFS